MNEMPKINTKFSAVKEILAKLLYNEKCICCVCFENDLNLIELEFTYSFIINHREHIVTIRQILEELFIFKVPYLFSNNICQKCNNDILKSYIVLKQIEINAQTIYECIKQLELETENAFFNLKHFKSKSHLNAIIFIKDIEDTDVNNDINYQEEYYEFPTIDKNQSSFICDCCNLVFNNKSSIKKHLLLVSSKKPYKRKVLLQPKTKCPVCSTYPCIHEKYLQTFQLTKLASNKTKKGQCADCNYSVLTKQLLIQHVNQKHLNIPASFVCEKCGKGFYGVHQLTQHISLNHVERIHCPFCDKIMRDQDCLKKHIAVCETEEKPIKCEHCPATFKTKLQAGIHNLKHVASFPCDECGCIMSTEFSLQYHKELKHIGLRSKVKPQLRCVLCDSIFTTVQRLEKHMNDYHNTVQYGCKVCDKSFKTGKEYYLHTERIEHLQKANIEKRFHCQHCDFAATRKYALESHINRSHLKRMPHVCDICNKSFINRILLLAHRERHNQEKRYKCKVCNNSFCGSMALKKHMRLHTGERPYKCPHCDMGFVCASHRQIHIKRKHGEKTEACPICTLKFNSLSELRKHIKIVHWKKDEPFDHRKLNYEEINAIFKDRRTNADF